MNEPLQDNAVRYQNQCGEFRRRGGERETRGILRHTLRRTALLEPVATAIPASAEEKELDISAREAIKIVFSTSKLDYPQVPRPAFPALSGDMRFEAAANAMREENLRLRQESQGCQRNKFQTTRFRQHADVGLNSPCSH